LVSGTDYFLSFCNNTEFSCYCPYITNRIEGVVQSGYGDNVSGEVWNVKTGIEGKEMIKGKTTYKVWGKYVYIYSPDACYVYLTGIPQ
jgi:hypothetical protein